jgi:hypothetical protein
MAVPTIGGVAGCVVRVGTLRFVHPTARWSRSWSGSLFGEVEWENGE